MGSNQTSDTMVRFHDKMSKFWRRVVLAWLVGSLLGSLMIGTRSTAQGNCSAKSLAGNVIDSSLSPLSSTSHAGWRGGVQVGGGGREHFIHLAMYCTTTWCFALKGLRTTTRMGGTSGDGERRSALYEECEMQHGGQPHLSLRAGLVRGEMYQLSKTCSGRQKKLSSLRQNRTG